MLFLESTQFFIGDRPGLVAMAFCVTIVGFLRLREAPARGSQNFSSIMQFENFFILYIKLEEGKRP